MTEQWVYAMTSVIVVSSVSFVGLLCLAAATIDVAIDGYAVENLRANERGWGNGVQVGGMFLGLACGGGGLLILYETLGWSSSLLLMAAVTGISLLPMLLRAEPPPPPEAIPDGVNRASVFAFFQRRDALRIVLFMLVLYGPMSLGLGLVPCLASSLAVYWGERCPRRGTYADAPV